MNNFFFAFDTSTLNLNDCLNVKVYLEKIEKKFWQ